MQSRVRVKVLDLLPRETSHPFSSAASSAIASSLVRYGECICQAQFHEGMQLRQPCAPLCAIARMHNSSVVRAPRTRSRPSRRQTSSCCTLGTRRTCEKTRMADEISK
eukprot:6172959-Pleurochrysis_carterae.AAC.1